MDKITWTNLGQFQENFTLEIAKLIVFAESQGIPPRIKDAFRDERVHGKFGERKGYGSPHSVHKLGLAVDLYTPNPEHHEVLHNYWDEVLYSAPRIINDRNHYSFIFDGKWY